MWEPQHLTTLWAFKACYRTRFTLFLRGRKLMDGKKTKSQGAHCFCSAPDIIIRVEDKTEETFR
jgi:hypothetical protein